MGSEDVFTVIVGCVVGREVVVIKSRSSYRPVRFSLADIRSASVRKFKFCDGDVDGAAMAVSSGITRPAG